MEPSAKATRIALFTFSTPQMRAFHMSWIAFFLCFFAWFGIAPLMSVVRDELQLTKEQVGWCVIGSVAITIFARLLVGWLCDRYRPAAHLHVAAVAGLASGDGHRAGPRLSRRSCCFAC